MTTKWVRKYLRKERERIYRLLARTNMVKNSPDDATLLLIVHTITLRSWSTDNFAIRFYIPSQKCGASLGGERKPIRLSSSRAYCFRPYLSGR